MSKKGREFRARGERLLVDALEHLRQAEIVAQAARLVFCTAARTMEWGMQHDSVVAQGWNAAHVQGETRRLSARLSERIPEAAPEPRDEVRRLSLIMLERIG